MVNEEVGISRTYESRITTNRVLFLASLPQEVSRLLILDTLLM
jgi:hypothetical protein